MARFSGPQHRDTVPKLTPVLSPRQTEILCMAAQGSTNQCIGSLLGVTEAAVKGHLYRLFKTLGARDRAHAVYLGCRHGLIPLGKSGA